MFCNKWNTSSNSYENIYDFLWNDSRWPGNPARDTPSWLDKCQWRAIGAGTSRGTHAGVAPIKEWGCVDLSMDTMHLK